MSHAPGRRRWRRRRSGRVRRARAPARRATPLKNDQRVALARAVRVEVSVPDPALAVPPAAAAPSAPPGEGKRPPLVEPPARTARPAPTGFAVRESRDPPAETVAWRGAAGASRGPTERREVGQERQPTELCSHTSRAKAGWWWVILQGRLQRGVCTCSIWPRYPAWRAWSMRLPIIATMRDASRRGSGRARLPFEALGGAGGRSRTMCDIAGGSPLGGERGTGCDVFMESLRLVLVRRSSTPVGGVAAGQGGMVGAGRQRGPPAHPSWTARSPAVPAAHSVVEVLTFCRHPRAGRSWPACALAAARCVAAELRKTVGVTKKSRSVLVMSPPRITTATG